MFCNKLQEALAFSWKIEPVREKPTLWAPTRSDTNAAVLSQNVEISYLVSRGIVLQCIRLAKTKALILAVR